MHFHQVSAETQMYLLFLDSGCKDKAYGPILKELMQTTNFRVTVVDESDVVEICGALKVNLNWFPFFSWNEQTKAKAAEPKQTSSLFSVMFQNVVAVGAGFCDGLGFGDNTKAAVIRLGLMEMIAFAKVFCTKGPVSSATFLESCGIADLITTCYGGRNRKIGEAFAKTGKVWRSSSISFLKRLCNKTNQEWKCLFFVQTIEQLENELLHGQKLQGPATAAEVHHILKQKKMIEK